MKKIVSIFTALTLALSAFSFSCAAGDGEGIELPPIDIDDVTETVTLGDVNSDSLINSSDALLVLQKVVGSTTLTENQIKAADVSKDSKISSYDALLILMYSVGEIDKF